MKQNQNINQEEDRLFLARKNNLEKIIQMGVDPYPKSFERSHLSTQVKDDLEKFENNKINESSIRKFCYCWKNYCYKRAGQNDIY